MRDQPDREASQHVQTEAQPAGLPLALRLALGFLLWSALFNVAVLLYRFWAAKSVSEALLLELFWRGLLALISLALAVEILLRIKGAWLWTAGFFLALPFVKAVRYALQPLSWQALGTYLRLQEVFSALVFVGLGLGVLVAKLGRKELERSV